METGRWAPAPSAVHTHQWGLSRGGACCPRRHRVSADGVRGATGWAGAWDHQVQGGGLVSRLEAMLPSTGGRSSKVQGGMWARGTGCGQGTGSATPGAVISLQPRHTSAFCPRWSRDVAAEPAWPAKPECLPRQGACRWRLGGRVHTCVPACTLAREHGPRPRPGRTCWPGQVEGVPILCCCAGDRGTASHTRSLNTAR